MGKKPLRLVIASGKGGVGKSMLVSNLAIILSVLSKNKKRVLVVDCDVDTPNQRVYFAKHINIIGEEWISESERAFLIEEKCDGCWKCLACSFNAISKDEENKKVIINQDLCEGCGLCSVVCPRKAIELRKVKNARITTYQTNFGFKIVSAELKPGSSGSGRIVDEVKKRAEAIARDEETEIIIYDSAAGIGCPVISSVTGSDYVILVSEPTPSSISDLKRVFEIVDHFNIESSIVINNSDYSQEYKEEIIRFAKENNIKVIGEIPNDKQFINALVNLEISVLYDERLIKYFKPIIELIEELFIKEDNEEGQKL